jgi:hypothetical protein
MKGNEKIHNSTKEGLNVKKGKKLMKKRQKMKI